MKSGHAQPRKEKFCIVGAGSSGLCVAKNFLAAGIAFDCLEREDNVGGNWYFGKPCSRIYGSTRLISSKCGTEYTDFPMPADWPEHPSHELVWQYLRDYARHFDLYPHIQFNTGIHRIERESESGWSVTLDKDNTRRYAGVVIANGHNWDPRWPEYPGEFAGNAIHSSQYKTPEICRGQRVLVVGGGNSGFDIAVDVAPHAAATFHSLRRAYHVLPRFYGGLPVDECAEWALRWRAPLWLRRRRAVRSQKVAWGEQVAQALPRPDHRLFETHPVINSRWPYAVSQGAVQVKPDIKKLANDRVAFTDGSEEPIDLVIYATGYKLSFPFIDREHLNWRGDRPSLYLNVFHPERDDIFVAGLIQPDSGQFGLVDYQAQLISAYVIGLRHGGALARNFQREKRQVVTQANGGVAYINSPRHAIEVEHFSYRRMLQRKIASLTR